MGKDAVPLPEVLVKHRCGVMWACCAPSPLGEEVAELIRADTCVCVPQLRRSPIKKVRKSLALDIVDEDMTQNVPALPKNICFKRTQVRGAVSRAGRGLAEMGLRGELGC